MELKEDFIVRTVRISSIIISLVNDDKQMFDITIEDATNPNFRALTIVDLNQQSYHDLLSVIDVDIDCNPPGVGTLIRVLCRKRDGKPYFVGNINRNKWFALSDVSVV